MIVGVIKAGSRLSGLAQRLLLFAGVTFVLLSRLTNSSRVIPARQNGRALVRVRA